MFKKRDKSKERDPNILREVADRVSDITSQVNNLEISNENPISSEDLVSDTPRYRSRSTSPSSVRNPMPSRSGSRERQTLNDDISNIHEMLFNMHRDLGLVDLNPTEKCIFLKIINEIEENKACLYILFWLKFFDLSHKKSEKSIKSNYSQMNFL